MQSDHVTWDSNVRQTMNPVIWYIAQFDLVCDRRWMVAAAKSIFMAGITCGTVVCGFFADRYGMNLNIQMRVPFVYGTKFSHHCARTCPSTLAGAVLTEKTTFIHTSFSERQWFCIYIRFVDRMMSFKIDEEMSRNRTALPVLPVRTVYAERHGQIHNTTGHLIDANGPFYYTI